MFKLGCRRGTIMALQTFEILTVVIVAVVLVLAVAWLGSSMAGNYFDRWIAQGGSW